MLESRSYYHELSGNPKKPKGWVVEIYYTFGGYAGSAGHSSKKKAENWLREHKETDNFKEDIKRVEIYKI